MPRSVRQTIHQIAPGNRFHAGKPDPTVPPNRSLRVHFGRADVRRVLGLVFLLLLILPSFIGSASAQNRVMIQDITGHLEERDNAFYTLSGLSKGDVLSVYAIGTSGNFDPMLMLFKPGTDFQKIHELFLEKIREAVAEGEDPVAASRDLLDTFSLAWNDDLDGKYDSALRFKIPAAGNYILLVRSALGYRTFGSYRLLLGLNAPEVLTGRATPTGDRFASLNRVASHLGRGVEEVRGTLEGKRYMRIKGIQPGDTLYVHVEAVSGNLRPTITLQDFGGKVLAIANFKGQGTSAALQYRFPRYMRDSTVIVSGTLRDKTVTTGDYRALIGVNAPEVLQGKGEAGGNPVLERPVPVKIGIKMQQISSVDQRSENFGVVATLMMKWEDPALAFRPDAAQTRVQVYTRESFTRKLNEEGKLWPDFSIYNQQGNRWIQNSAAVVFADGRVLYLERFSVTLQAPDFDFRQFPFDKQSFFIRVDSIFPSWFFVFEDLKGFSEAGKQLGEEEWIVTDIDTSIDRAELAERPVSRFNFHFRARRHLTYYAFRIFLPLLIIIVVSWIIFFLKDYTKRIDASGANLLLFIAFNFAISSDLPRLGYMTFLDMLLAAVFVVTALMLILAVLVRRLVSDGRDLLVNRIDRYVVWFYPFAYVVGLLVVILISR